MEKYCIVYSTLLYWTIPCSAVLPNSSSPERYTQSLPHHSEMPDMNPNIRTNLNPEPTIITESHPCQRPCTNGTNMVCTYAFVVQWYQTLSKACYRCPYTRKDCYRPHCVTGDGTKKLIISINRQSPGPLIDVCQGDTVVVEVVNHMHDTSTSIHWHGQEQVRSPYMDGVPFVTQCPISPATSFTYRFSCAKAGTHFYHSHSAGQRGDGLYGALIVRPQPGNDPNSHLYDHDVPQNYTMILMDATKFTSNAKFYNRHHDDGDISATSLLINGRGTYTKFVNTSGDEIQVPRTRFVVKQGQRYRFRVISNGFLNCPIEVSVDDHDITIISVDGNAVKPVTAASFVIYAGERYDIVIKANRTIGLYWIRYKGGLFCGSDWTKVHHEVVLQYEGASDVEYPIAKIGFEESHKEGLQIGGIDKGSGEKGFRAISELQSYRTKDDILKSQPDVQMFLTYDFYYVDNPEFHYPGLYGISELKDTNQVVNMPLINHISYAFPPFPLLPQRDMNNPKQFCNRTTIDEKDCSHKFCSCTHIIKLPLNAVVELIVIDSGISSSVTSHPMHLHGYTFRVLALNKLGRHLTEEDVRQRDREGLIKRNLVDPPEKDTLAIPTGGYAVIRIVSSNPGYWLFHCHLDFHSELGMALVFQVGENSDMLPVPRKFPQCGSYVPSTAETPNSFLYTVTIILYLIYLVS